MSKKIFDLDDNICEEMYGIRSQEYCHIMPTIDDAINQIVQEIVSMYPEDKRTMLEDRITQPFIEREIVGQKDFYLQGIADGMNLAETLAKVDKVRS